MSSVAKLWHKFTGLLSAHSGNTVARSASPHPAGPLETQTEAQPKITADQAHDPSLERPPDQAVAEESEDILDERGRQPVPGVTLFHTFKGHASAVRCVAFDPEGLTLASGSSDSTIKIWDLNSGQLLNTLEGHFQNSVFSVAFDFEGRTLVSGTNKGFIDQRETSRGEVVRALERRCHGTVFSVAFDSQGRWLVGATDHGVIELWDATSGKLLRFLEGHELSVYCLAFDPEGRRLASGGNDKTIKLWDVGRNRLLRTINGHTGTVRSVVFDPTGHTLASGSTDTTIKLWDVKSGEMLRSLNGHTSRVEALAYSCDGTLLASKCRAGTIRIWNCETWKTVAIIPEPTFSKWWIPALAFHPSLPLLATAGSEPDAPEALRSRRVHLWELDVDLLLGDDLPVPIIDDVHAKTRQADDTGVAGPEEKPRDQRQADALKELNVGTEILDLG